MIITAYPGSSAVHLYQWPCSHQNSPEPAEFTCTSSIQFRSVPRLIGSSGVHKGQFSTKPLPVLSAGGPCEQFWHGQVCPLFDVVHTAFSLLTVASPTFQGALKDSFGEAVVSCDMPEPCKFPSLDSCQKKFPWTHKEVNLAPHPVVGLELQEGEAGKFRFLRHLVSRAGGGGWR